MKLPTHSRLLLIAILAISGILNAQAERIALQMGGNCESVFNREGSQNIFFNEMILERSILSSHGWETHSLYDGSTDEFKRMLDRPNKPANNIETSSKERFFAKLDALIEKTSSGGTGQNQVLIAMNSHGSNGGICISENESLSFNDPELQKRLSKLKQNAKIGIIVESCYSGSAIPELSKFGCVLSSQAANSFGTSGAGGMGMIELLGNDYSKTGSSMEDLFLHMQANSKENLPQLSGFSEGKIISENYFSQFSNTADADFLSGFKKLPVGCETPETISKLKKSLNETLGFMNNERIKKLYPSVKPNQKPLEALMKTLQDHAKLKTQYSKLSNRYSEVINEMKSKEDKSMLVEELLSLSEKLEKIEFQFNEQNFLGEIDSASGSLTKKTKKTEIQISELKTLNRYLSARYLKSNGEKLSPEDQAARKSCQDFQLFQARPASDDQDTASTKK